ncbi:receptor-type tyrosine-protein phosphatase t [Plakobranchus ocellatus]|uniref:Receptor-type tyrosine-protein phosphatase t n=1 Tax=Plakobranchus ocellatus TaxID=259542 RepID=A0AAV4BS98_9GAST|nr:receptor-type tyrosine-protein phosphatase t [Plakobranchus ocellatus]
MLGTLDAFWNMVWLQNSAVVVMLSRLVENCKNQSYKYWPDVGDCLDLEDVNLSTEEEDTRSAYVMRKLSLSHSKTGEQREVTLLQFTAWPDSGPSCPAAILSMWRSFRRLKNVGSGPPIVQCSNGSERCGLFLVLDTVISQWEETDMIDVVNCVTKVREDRRGFLDSFEQYAYLYKILAEIVLCAPTRNIEREKSEQVGVMGRLINQDELTDNNENISTDVETTLKNNRPPRSNDKDNTFVYPNTEVTGCTAHRFLYPDVTQDLMVTCVTLEHRSVKRLSEHCVYRLRHSISLQDNKMMLGIAGVLPSQCQSSFLVPESISRSQDLEFWQLVFDTGCRTVVKLMMDKISNKPDMWPLYTDDFSIEATSHLRLRDVIKETTLALRTNMEPLPPLDEDISSETTIKMFTVPWSRETSSSHMIPPHDDIVFLYELLCRWLQQTHTTVIAIEGGNNTEASGHFCATFNMMTSLQSDGQVNMRQVVRAVQCSLPDVISQTDYVHLYGLKDHYVYQRRQNVNNTNKRCFLKFGSNVEANTSREQNNPFGLLTKL